jgi:hypothetical protein
MAKPQSDKNRARLARLEELGFSYRELGTEGSSLVTMIGEARADPPDPETIAQADRDLAGALAAIEADLHSTDEPGAVIERTAVAARAARERYADARNVTARPASSDE